MISRPLHLLLAVSLGLLLMTPLPHSAKWGQGWGRSQPDRTVSQLFAAPPDSPAAAWPPLQSEERLAERERLVRRHLSDIEDERVLEAMRGVPRHRYVPANQREHAYANRPLPIGMGQTISQPYIVASMTETLQLERGDRVLEIGTGSGYQASVLAWITPHVYTIEILDELGEQARRRFRELGYGTIASRIGDGYYGWEEEAPFDGIIVTCAAGHVPPPLVQQLAPGGRMVIPVGGVYEVQRLILVQKDEAGEVSHSNLYPVRFVPMIGHSD